MLLPKAANNNGGLERHRLTFSALVESSLESIKFLLGRFYSAATPAILFNRECSAFVRSGPNNRVWDE